jgi:hypothetical protein
MSREVYTAKLNDVELDGLYEHLGISTENNFYVEDTLAIIKYYFMNDVTNWGIVFNPYILWVDYTIHFSINSESLVSKDDITALKEKGFTPNNKGVIYGKIEIDSELFEIVNQVEFSNDGTYFFTSVSVDLRNNKIFVS